MTLENWLLFLLAVQLVHGLGTWKLYTKAGKKAWQAFIPIYNAVILMQIINRPWWWTLLLFLPIVNLIMIPVVWVETARSFGKNTNTDTFFCLITLGFYLYYINYVDEVTYIENRDLHPKTAAGDWVSSILFAVVAATIVHTYFIQPFTIPTSSLEKSLLVGDFLFVSKMHYGARIPMTTLAAPMVHDTIPILKTKSYREKPELPYMRLPGFQKIKQNDIVVFNWPVDTMLDMRHTDKHYYKPIDKRTNYVKRCVGLPGDSLEIRNGYVYINGKQNHLPERAKLQFSYNIFFKGQLNSVADVYRILKKYDITDNIYQDQHQNFVVQATEEAANAIKNHPNIDRLEIRKEQPGVRGFGIFPNHPEYNWNNDFFGPIYIPEKGKTIALTLDALPLYKRLITAYEGNTLRVEGNQIFINGEVADSYTFKQDYYWMMGDNRHNSQDARVWGFVPFDHVVGKPVFIWMSWDGLKNPRWERFFTTVHGSGKPVSYLIPFLVLLAVWFGFNKWRKQKKENKPS
ncbi:MAG TPA: signal peptidase I [Flavobacteriaceae bacterium]|nr:signal peptidase I [Flavobacteriaceae bacterium]